MRTMSGEQISVKKMQIAGWFYLLAIFAASVMAFSLDVALSVLAGGIISLLSFMVACRELVGLFAGASSQGRENDAGRGQKKAAHSVKGFLVRFWIRIVSIGVVLLVLIKSGKMHIPGLIIGLSTAVFTVIFTSLSMVKHQLSNGRR